MNAAQPWYADGNIVACLVFFPVALWLAFSQVGRQRRRWRFYWSLVAIAFGLDFIWLVAKRLLH
jgi:hypothetical protein